MGGGGGLSGFENQRKNLTGFFYKLIFFHKKFIWVCKKFKTHLKIIICIYIKNSKLHRNMHKCSKNLWIKINIKLKGGGEEKKNRLPCFDLLLFSEKHYDKPYPKIMNAVHFPNYSRLIPYYTLPILDLKKNFSNFH